MLSGGGSSDGGVVGGFKKTFFVDMVQGTFT